MRSFVFALLFLFSFTLLPAQETVYQNNPTYLKWYQVKTDHFRVLYPQGFEQQALRMANTLEHIREPEARTMGVKPRPISILLQNQSSISNGFVTMAPRRSEFFAMPPQNYNFLGTNDWLDLLASHEYRHIVQYQRSITGFNKFLYYVFGQQTLAGMAFVNTPQWFWEGDAVATETAFTHSGRGRIPNFDLLFRTNFQEGRVFNYSKQYLRSYKHNIPDHYVLGYHMISYLRKKTGDPDIWNKVARRSWSVPFLPFRFSNSIKAASGLTVNGLFKEMSAEMKKEWEQQTSKLQPTVFERVNTRTSKAYTDYQNPQVLEDGSIVAVKTGIGDISQLVILSSSGKEKKGYIQGPVNSTGMLSAAGTRVVWNEYRYDPRWLMRTYSVIKAYDFKTGQSHVITHKSRYAGAALSPDGTQVATVETGTDYKTKLVVLDYTNGSVIKAFDNPENRFISMPRFTADGKYIVAIRTIDHGKTLTRFDLASGAMEDLIPVTQENIGHPVPHQQYVLYNSPVSGIDNIYALDTKTGKRYQVTSSKYGAYNPALSEDGLTVYYNEQTRDGMDVVKIAFDPVYWKPMEEITQSGIGFHEHLVEQEGRPGLLDSVPARSFPLKKYSKLKGIINPHSWGPYVNSDLTSLNVGIISQDILSTTTISGGYAFDATERTGSWNARVSYQALYPIIDFNINAGERSAKEGGLNMPTGRTEVKFGWHETNTEVGLRIPLLTTKSKYNSKIEFGNAVGVTHITDFKNDINNGGRFIPVDPSRPNNGGYFFRSYVDNGYLVYNKFTLSAYRLLKLSRRDINSKWGQSLSATAYSTPYGGDFTGSQFSVLGILYFPGLFKHHSFWGYGGYQHTLVENKLDNYLFRNTAPGPRAQSIARFQDYYIMSANYTLPLWYPDIAVGPIVNFQRVRGNAFIDYAYGSSPLFQNSQQYTTVGGELKFDVNIMRFLPQWNFGVRYSYAVETQTPKVEFLMGTIGF
jgi:hypothetical protein